VVNYLKKNWLIIAWILSFALIAAGILRVEGLAHQIRENSQDRAIAVREGQIQNCEIISVPLQKASIEIIKQQIAVLKQEIESNQLLSPKEYEQAFPELPEHVNIKELVKQELANNKAALQRDKEILDELNSFPSCEERYPPLPHT
jgi:hypothetical protein